MISTPNSMKTGSQSIRKKPEAGAVKLLLHLSAPYTFQLILACLCVVIVNGALLIQPLLLQRVIDHFLIGGAVERGLDSIGGLALLYLLVSAASAVFSYLQALIVGKAGQSLIHELRVRVFSIIERLPLPYLDRTSSGRLITRATNDTSEISDLYTDVIISLVKDVLLLAGIVYAMLVLSPKLTLVSFTVIPVIVFLVFFIKNKIKKNFFHMKHYIGQINGFIAESISGMRVIQIFRAEKEKEQQFLKLNGEYFNTTLIQVRLNSILKPASDMFQSLAIAILVWYSVGRIAGGTLQIGVLYAFTTYIKQFFAPVSDLADKYTSIQSAFVSTERIFELIREEEHLEEPDAGLPMQRLNGRIEFRRVWFSYNGADWVLKDVSFVIEKGQTAAFIGETGAGKTTIISLINGFYKVQKGEILIDGVNVNDIRLDDLRRNISVVLQDVFLFSGTIRDNITLGDDIDDDTVLDALRASCAEAFVHSAPEGIDEPVTERGSTLSAGQRQLISFARAIAHDPAIFVLDEATANIDTRTEKLIQQAIDNAASGRTTLIIAHRLSTITGADLIIAMKAGRIAESGHPRELLKRGGYYAKLLQESRDHVYSS
ncbi:ABC transporter ATP-binding protein [Paenibacillus riograndensis]|uniref:Xenobiotic ABC transporter ATPase n=1 Tax=Paenibacillus riograndensis SBR5 TaxID=1073571 RepID=A0A0E4CYL9_9BACL|nr:ABC transporter ATP-binding protein [Paenibacillus riograndensis]CQR57642.1 xenobiotic ABC transporter ATPase [Paenibacillus riograndensis SBR5]